MNEKELLPLIQSFNQAMTENKLDQTLLDTVSEEEAKALLMYSDLSKPQHLAIIMDGNGRWAKKQGLPRSYGHKVGAERLRDVCEWASDAGIRYLTVYAFSTENWSRPKLEVRFLQKLLISFSKTLKKDLKKQQVRVRFIGDLDVLPQDVLDAINTMVFDTKDHQGITLIIAFNYGGRLEILQAAQRFAQKALESPQLLDTKDPESFREFLYAPDIPDPELLIRTSGEIRLSNFLLWSLAYTEIWISSDFWPDFSPKTLLEACISYSKRERRYGGLSS